MKGWHGTAIVALLAAVLGVQAVSIARTPTVAWKYKIDTVSDADALDRHGAMGWELVSARWLGDKYEVVLRKPR